MKLRKLLMTHFALPFLALWALMVAGCAHKPQTPPQAPPAVEVKVPVPVPCKVEQVKPSRLPTETLPVTGDPFNDVKLLLADRSTLKADRDRLVAANTNPCNPLETK